ncbi:MAG: hypothetical protein U0166_05755 [Acidobacteriota bacterium]
MTAGDRGPLPCPCGGNATPSPQFPSAWECDTCRKVYADRKFLDVAKRLSRQAARRPRIRAEPQCPKCGSTNIEEISRVERAGKIAVAIAAAQPSLLDDQRAFCRSCGARW